MKLTKTLSVLLGFIIIFLTIFSCFNVSAENSFNVYGTDVTIKTSETKFTVDIVLENNPGISAIILYLDYNKEYFTLTDIENNVQDLNMTVGTMLVFDSKTIYSKDGTLATLYFELNMEVPDGNYPIYVLCYEAVNFDGLSLDVSAKASNVSVTNVTLGDINDDTFVNTSDLALLKLNLAGAYTFTYKQNVAANVNNDETVNTSDLALLKLKLAGAIAEF